MEGYKRGKYKKINNDNYFLTIIKGSRNVYFLTFLLPF